MQTLMWIAVAVALFLALDWFLRRPIKPKD